MEIVVYVEKTIQYLKVGVFMWINIVYKVIKKAIVLNAGKDQYHMEINVYYFSIIALHMDLIEFVIKHTILIS